MNVSDDDWKAIFGCREHGGKVWADHTMEEKAEHESHGQEDQEVDQEGRRLLKPRGGGGEFDSGVVPDLHCDEGPGVWKNYEPGVGPIIRNNAELKRYCELTGHTIKGQTHVEEVTRMHDGAPSRFKKKIRVDDGFEPTYGKFRRDPSEIREAKKLYENGQKWVARMNAEQEKRRHDTKKIFYMP